MRYWALYAVAHNGSRTLHSLHSFRGAAIATKERARNFSENGWYVDYVIEPVESQAALKAVLAA